MTRRETVNVVLTAVLLAGLVCLLILGGVAGGSGGPADPRPSTEAPRRSSEEDRPGPGIWNDSPPATSGTLARARRSALNR